MATCGRISSGFDPANPGPFIEALLDHGDVRNLVRTMRNEFGIKYVCEGPMPAPRGIIRRIRSVWRTKPDEVWRWLVTAYPV